LQAEGIEVSGIVCHVGKSDHRTALVEHTLAKYGGLDILVSNAAVNPYYGPVMKVRAHAGRMPPNHAAYAHGGLL